MKKLFLLLILVRFSVVAMAQDVNALVLKVKAKIEQVNDYEASGKMKTNVAFLKVPIATI